MVLLAKGRHLSEPENSSAAISAGVESHCKLLLE